MSRTTQPRRIGRSLQRLSLGLLLWLTATHLIVVVGAQEEAAAAADTAAPAEEASVVWDDLIQDATEENTVVMGTTDDDEDEITVEDYLATLSVEELQAICWDRGFDIEEQASSSTGSGLVYEDFLEAARRCLSLEEEMNAVLNEHPELAAEIEKEIERLRDTKSRLEEERATMLAEKALLEQQLQQAGVNFENFKDQVDPSSLRAPTDPADMSITQLLRESLSQLYDRVAQDVKFVVRVTEPVWRTVGQGMEVVWRYMKPTVLQAYTEVRKRVEQVLPSAGEAEAPTAEE
jgi:hypothetical protein